MGLPGVFLVYQQTYAQMAELSVEPETVEAWNGLECDASNADHSLIRQVADGDPEAFTELIELHGNRLARLIGRLTAWQADEDDILQEVFLTVWQKAGTFNGQGSLEGWLKRIAVNRCRNHYRKLTGIRRKIEGFATMVFASGRQQYETCFEITEETHGIHHALEKLTLEHRMILVLYYLEEMPGPMVAEWMDIKTETFHVRLHRARQKLKKILEES